ncbi:MAG: hypothetical protein SAL07_09615 [Oscillatoria sp. PMC 1051.18]|nr:hypothetical protein [Oscillatoria sp. PMC 1050.18]MEC5030159.1 hypothetical protein [Oscillatoria sp. PMC 1051.18]
MTRQPHDQFAKQYLTELLASLGTVEISKEVPETLWLRILGKGTTQQQAISELIALPEANLLRVNTLELIANWRINLQMRENLTDEDRELIMNLSPAYLQWREATLNEGVQQGVQQGIQQGSLQGQRLVIENLLQVRFGSRDESILQIVDALLALPPQEYTRLILQLSREELLVRCGKYQG